MLSDPNDQAAIALSIAPSVTAIGAGTGDGGGFYMGAKVPVLVGIPVGSSELTLAPRLSPYFVTAGAGDGNASGFGLSGGGSVGFAARVGDTFWVLPEISVEVPSLPPEPRLTVRAAHRKAMSDSEELSSTLVSVYSSGDAA